MIYVSHFLEELLDISDNLVILRNGRRVPVHFTPSGDRLKDVVAAMLGEAAESIAEQSQNSNSEIDLSGPIAPIKVGPLRIVGLKGPAGLVIDKLEINPGAIVGVAGLAGAGVEELFAVLFGLTKPTSGSITLPTGAPLPPKTGKAVKAGVAYSPADRKQ
jgi:ABC-type sugar transport system ATPase subunit